MKQVLVAMPSGAVRDVLAQSLRNGGFRTHTSASGLRSHVAAIQRVQPVACLLDPRPLLTTPAGIEAVCRAAGAAPVIAVLPRTARAAFITAVAQGVQGVVLLEQPECAGDAVKQALAGEVVIPRALLPALMAAVRSHELLDRQTGSVAQLTHRERQILELLARGLTTNQIAHQLVVAPVTVRSHAAAIMRKLQVSDRDAAIDLMRASSQVPASRS